MSGPMLRVYNPGTLTDDELRAQFVARTPIYEDLLGELRGAERPQHQLLVGARGMGKTTLLRRIALGVREDAALVARWMPVPFEEEQYNVAHLSDFWANCLDALGDALEQAGDHAGAAALDAIVDALPTAEAQRADTAWRALSTWAREHRRLVLLIDNLDLVLGRLDPDDEWTLRECLGDQADIVVIAASPHGLDADVDYSRAFFDYFAVTELRPLPLAEAERLLRTLGERFGATRVVQTLDHSPGVVRALHALGGGNPRALVLLYNVLSHEELASAHGYLEGMLDLATPLFKARIEELAPQAQQVLVGLALAEDPLTAPELAARIRLEPTVVAVQLGRLVKDGLVARIERPGTRATAHLVAERVMALWYRMRASRRDRRRLEAQVDFLEMIYGADRLREQARRLADRMRDEADERDARLSMVVGARFDEPGILASVAECFSGELERLRGLVGELADNDGEFDQVTTMAQRMATLKEAERAIRAAEVDWASLGVRVEEFVELLLGSISLTPEEKGKIGGQFNRLSMAQIAELATIFREENEAFTQMFGDDGWQALRLAFRRGYMADPHDLPDARAAAGRLDAPDLPRLVAAICVADHRPLDEPFRAQVRSAGPDAGAFVRSARAQLAVADLPEEAEAIRREALAANPRLFACRTALARQVAQRGDVGEALEILRATPEDRPTRLRAVMETTVSIARSAGDRQVATEAFERWIGTFDADADAPLREYASFLAEDADQTEMATRIARRAVAANPADPESHRLVGRMLEVQERWPEALEHRRRVLDLEPSKTEALRVAWTARRAGALDLAESILDDWLQREPDDARLWYERHWIHAERGQHVDAARTAARAAELNPAAESYRNSAAWGLYLSRTDARPAEPLARTLTTSDDPRVTHTAATVLTWTGHWDEALPPARHFLTKGDDAYVADTWPDIVLFFKEAVTTGHAADAHQLLVDTNRAEAWRPLAEALRACAAGSDLHLRALLPELRDPALLLYEQLGGPPTPERPAPRAGAARNAADRREAGPRKTTAPGRRRGG